MHNDKISTITFRVPQQMFDEIQYLIKPQYGSVYKLIQKELQKTVTGDFHAARMGTYIQELNEAKQRLLDCQKHQSQVDPMYKYNGDHLLAMYHLKSQKLVSYHDVIGGTKKFQDWAQAHSYFLDPSKVVTQLRFLQLYQMTYQWYLKSNKVKLLSVKLPNALKHASVNTIHQKGWRVSQYLRNVIRYYVDQSVYGADHNADDDYGIHDWHHGNREVIPSPTWQQSIVKRLDRIDQNQVKIDRWINQHH